MGAVLTAAATGASFDRELAGCSLADERLNKRLCKLLKRMGAPWESGRSGALLHRSPLRTVRAVE